MKLLIIKSGKNYIRFKDHDYILVTIDKASVFPMDQIKVVQKHAFHIQDRYLQGAHGVPRPRVEDALKTVLAVEDIGLHIRKNSELNHLEIISDRVFIDESTIEEISQALPQAQSLITYLANSIAANGRQTPSWAF